MSNIKTINELTPGEIASICDHTFLERAECYRTIVEKGQSGVRMYREAFDNFLRGTIHGEHVPYAVCIQPEEVEHAKEIIGSRGIKIASVIGFPEGPKYSTEFKIGRLEDVADAGADEIDFVANYDLARAEDYHLIAEEFSKIGQIAQEYGVLSKVILETSELTYDQVREVCEIANENHLDFVKTSTGFGSGGATVDDLEIMRNSFSKGVKASGGITPENLHSMLYAMSGRSDGKIDLDPMKIRIGESSLLKKLAGENGSESGY
ncbi:deoxyribose-phosphate aldolase [archaeon]|jgi:deoxyribose-phosphate aldolase|nr:deoxyribose-phosphate aldolase [archaeon]MBT3577312.1 deoxyribose-phosphate aldolase [archaeon]MBT6820444.1 deoxyribose-phosphate aldolase [archaeon]MBT6956269.1 deoxyribose-phosphate aldolase [archaeon]MBT7025258.1 deoxyribose-phosphate aldolase [archaeon]